VKLLLDTHIVLWPALQPNRLSAAARKLLNDPRNELFFSAASLWEIAIKKALGREDFRVEAPFAPQSARKRLHRVTDYRRTCR
jgi:PIN domain nuclease of toxin-antitoxin system